MNTPNPTPMPLFLHASIDGQPVNFEDVARAVWDGEISDLSRIDVVLTQRPYLSDRELPAPDQLPRY